ncbi:MAG: hypothetical protein L0216_10185 [Planctomycetales bacterium]|nr:hypothetical protein [Planctomycetales bacterium]
MPLAQRTVPVLAILGAILAAPTARPDEPKDAPRTYDLSFFPADGRSLRVRYAADTTWDYRPEDDMHGAMRTELTLRWKLDRGGDRAPVVGNATLDRVLYQGQGVKKGKPFDIGIEWNRKEGYLRGRDTEEDRTWVAGEIQEGVRLAVDRRGCCSEGAC